MLKLGDLAVAGVLALGLKAYLDRMPTPPPAPPTPNTGMLGFGKLTQPELATALFGGETFSEVYGGGKPSTAAQREAWSNIVIPREKTLAGGYEKWSIGGSLLPEGYAETAAGPSKQGLTRPKGLD